MDCSDIRLVLSSKICSFFREHQEWSANVPGPPPGPWAAHRPESVAALLGVVTHLREQPLPPHLKKSAREQNCWENNFWVANLDYLQCAEAALTCGAAFSAWQLASVWCYQQEGEGGVAGEGGSLLESLARGRQGEAVQGVLRRAALLLGDLDSALGVGCGSLGPEQRTARLALEGQYGLALPLCDAMSLGKGHGAR